MMILHIQDYNKMQKDKYRKACQSWNPKDGGFPQIAFYLFFTPSGKERQTGYVAFNNTSAYWRKTKKEAIKAYKSIELKQYKVCLYYDYHEKNVQSIRVKARNTKEAILNAYKVTNLRLVSHVTKEGDTR